jgi:predicted flavoprotein YhiN
MKGKTTFKEEFVTSGGVNLKEIDFKTMQSKLMPNLYFCGEVLDIDGITGGFNFQNAWSTAYIAASSV